MRVKYINNDVNVEVTDSDNYRGPEEIDGNAKSDIEHILDETGFGKFNYKILIVTGLMALNTSFSITSLALILTPAACDFNMNTVDKSRLNSSVLFGMLFGSCIWGCIADTRGRRIAILNCLFLEGFINCIASFASNYWGFLLLKFSSGIPLSGQTALLYTYLGEFQPARYRQKVLSVIDIALILGLTVAPLLAWLIIPLDIHWTYSFLLFKSWNLYVLIAALPALIIGCMVLRMPETPMYLAESGQYNDLQKVVMSMYHENTGKSPEEYNFAKLKAAGVKLLVSRQNGMTNIIKRNGIERSGYKPFTISVFLHFFKTLYAQTRILFRPPYTGKTINLCISTYFILSTIYTIMVWYPELFNRFAIFEETHPGEQMNICIVSEWYSHNVRNNETIANSSRVPTDTLDNTSMISYCDAIAEPEVYIESAIVGVTSLPVSILFLMGVNRLGFRFILLFSISISCGINIALLFVTSSRQNLVLSCIYEALMSTCEVTAGCLIVELFPTNLRATASALASLFGRAGSLIGNTTFSYLIDDHCIVLISIVTVEVFLTGLLAVFLPKRK